MKKVESITGENMRELLAGIEENKMTIKALQKNIRSADQKIKEILIDGGHSDLLKVDYSRLNRVVW